MRQAIRECWQPCLCCLHRCPAGSSKTLRGQPGRLTTRSRRAVIGSMRRGIIAAGLLALVACQSPKSSTPIVAEDANRPAQRAPDENELLLNSFLEDLGANRFDAGYAKMAAPYRQANTVDQFKAAVAACPYLSIARRVTIRRTFEDTAVTEAFLSTSKGTLFMSAFVVREGLARRILVLAIAGVPVLQGITAAATARNP